VALRRSIPNVGKLLPECTVKNMSCSEHPDSVDEEEDTERDSNVLVLVMPLAAKVFCCVSCVRPNSLDSSLFRTSGSAVFSFTNSVLDAFSKGSPLLISATGFSRLRPEDEGVIDIIAMAIVSIV